MKQRILLILMIGFFTQVYTQDKKIDFQISLGPTFSIPKTSELSNTNFDGSPEVKSSINIGAFVLPSVNYSLNENYSLNFGIGFFLDRFSIEDKIGIVTNNGNRSISQIQTPLSFNFHFGQDKSYEFGLGGFASFLLSAKESGTTVTDLSRIDIIDPNDSIINNNLPVDYNNDIKENYNLFNFGAFIQLKKNISFTSEKKGFVLLRISQYLNSIKSKKSVSSLENEKEPTTVNFGIGIIL